MLAGRFRVAAPMLTAAALAISMSAPTVVRAATFTTTRFDDPKPDGCAAANCSLREAIIAANKTPGSTVQLRAGTYSLTRTGWDTTSPNAKIGDLDIMVSMTVRGAGSGATYIQAGTARGAGIHRIFDVFSTSLVLISDLTMRFGSDVEARSGGCLKNTGVLTLDRVIVTSCTSPLGGGGISSYRNLIVRDSRIVYNKASSNSRQVNGGGIAAGPMTGGWPGTVTIIRTLVANNEARSTRPYIGYGGGFVNTAIMTIEDSVVSGNVADSSAGGLSDPRGSNPDGTMTLDRTTFSENKASRDAGGLTNDGTMTVKNSTFSANEAGYQCNGNDCQQAYAGGLLSTASASTNVFNSTFSGNVCHVSGGGLLQSAGGTLRIRSSTVVDNRCDQYGGGIGSNPQGTTRLKDSIVANNTAGGLSSDCTAVVTSEGYNLVESTASCTITGNTTGNLIGTDPHLGALLDNGGPTATQAALLGSPTLNAGDPAGCTDTAGNVLAFDQRGFFRPSDGRCDIGAYERSTAAVLWTTDNRAEVWQMNGPKVESTRGYTGPGQGWTAESYSRDPNGTYQLLWSSDNAARIYRYQANHTLIGTVSHTGPGAGWKASSLFALVDGSYQLLWANDNAAQVWTINANGSRGPTLTKTGPSGFQATSSYQANDGTRQLVWTDVGNVRIWTLTAEGVFRTSLGYGGPGIAGDWTATSYNLNDDGTFAVLWTTTDGQVKIWTMDASGRFSSSIGLGGGAGWSTKSYFFN
jgi:CSLREA domain-containing protein